MKDLKVWTKQFGELTNTIIDDYYSYIDLRLSEKYKKVADGICHYLFPSGEAGRLSYSDRYKSFWIEYADNLEMASRGLFPWDGDGYFIEQLTKEEMADEIIKEIESD